MYNNSLKGDTLPDVYVKGRRAAVREGTESIGPGAFGSAEGIKTLVLPQSLVRISPLSFLPDLERIEVSKKNPYFASKNGVLYSRDKKRLICFPAGRREKRCVMDPETEAVEKEAFARCRHLETVVFSPKVSRIGKEAFAASHADIEIPAESPFFIKKNGGVYSADGTRLYLLKTREKSLRLDAGVKAIEGEAFYEEDCPLEEVFLPEGLESISSFPFALCGRLDTVHAPESLGEASLARISSPALSRVVFTSPEPRFAFRRGGVYSADGKTLFLQTAAEGYDITVTEETEKIGDFAFSGCPALRVTLPQGLKEIGEMAFSPIHTGGLRTEELALSSEPCAAENAFLGAGLRVVTETEAGRRFARRFGLEALEESAIDNKLTVKDDAVTGAEGGVLTLGGIPAEQAPASIADNAFSCCITLKSAVLPECIRKIGSLAFSGCGNLAEAYISRFVSEIGEANPFAGAVRLRKIGVSPENPYYTEYDGCLYNKEKTLLICCPAGKEDRVLRVPEGVTNISPFAFDRCGNIEEIYLPDSLGNIGLPAFSGCIRLKKIHVNNGFFSVKDGMLFIKVRDLRLLVSLPGGISAEQIALPADTAGVCGGALSFCRVKKVILPPGLKMLQPRAFIGGDVEEVSIPKGCFPAPEAFFRCESLREVRFGGLTPVIPVAFAGCPELSRRSRRRIALRVKLGYWYSVLHRLFSGRI